MEVAVRAPRSGSERPSLAVQLRLLALQHHDRLGQRHHPVWLSWLIWELQPLVGPRTTRHNSSNGGAKPIHTRVRPHVRSPCLAEAQSRAACPHPPSTVGYQYASRASQSASVQSEPTQLRSVLIATPCTYLLLVGGAQEPAWNPSKECFVQGVCCKQCGGSVGTFYDEKFSNPENGVKGPCYKLTHVRTTKAGKRSAFDLYSIHGRACQI